MRTVKKKVLNKFRPQVRSQHPSHEWVRDNLPLMPFRSVVRLGSTTEFNDTVAKGGKRIELNSTDSINNSSNKRLMKECFVRADIKTAPWFYTNNKNLLKEAKRVTEDWKKSLVMKNIHGSRGRGNYLIKSEAELKTWAENRNLSNFIGEAFFTGIREYRLHVTKEGCFYTCRKVLKADTPDDKRWYRNDSNCNWLVEENADFEKPTNWDKIVKDCVKALDELGGDIMGFDVKVQNAKDNEGRVRKDPDYIIIESNSACSHGEITKKKYVEIIPKILMSKYEEHKV